MIEAPKPTYIGDIYRFQWEESGIEMVLDRIIESHGAVKGEITVRSDVYGKLHGRSQFNVSGPNGRRDLARALRERISEDVIDWTGALNQVCELSLERWREGEPLIDLATVKPGEKPPFLLPAIVIDRAPTVLFGDGSAGKSLFALACAVSISTGLPILGIEPTEQRKVLYLDWEWDEEAHAERLRAVLRGAGYDPDTFPVDTLLYRHQTASLAESAGTVRRLIGQAGIGHVIVDSLGAARGGEPESADLTIRTFNAMRSWEVPVHVLDHVTKNGEQRADKPFGSAFTYNLGRLLWSIEKVQEEDETTSTIQLRNTKTNRGRLMGRRAWTAKFEEDGEGNLYSVRYEAKDPTTIKAFMAKASARDQIIGLMREENRALSAHEIVTELEAQGIAMQLATVRQTLQRFKGTAWAQVVEGIGKNEAKWGLLSREIAS